MFGSLSPGDPSTCEPKPLLDRATLTLHTLGPVEANALTEPQGIRCPQPDTDVSGPEAGVMVVPLILLLTCPGWFPTRQA